MAALFWMKAAAIDLGTNTFELLIAEIDPAGEWSSVYSDEVAVFLGKGGIEKNIITNEALDRALLCLSGWCAKIRDEECQRIRCTATSALRNAANSSEAIERIHRETGLHVEVITGEQEAGYIAKGTALAMGDLEDPYLVMDIGGGSTEFIVMDGQKILFKRSIEIGAIRLIERHGISDPLDPLELAEMERSIAEGSFPVMEVMNKHWVKTLVGGSGAFDSFKAILNIQQIGPVAKFDPNTLLQTLENILGSSKTKRRSTPGLVEYRVDTIIPSALMIKHFIKAGVSEIRWCGYALKEGVMQEMAEEIAPA